MNTCTARTKVGLLRYCCMAVLATGLLLNACGFHLHGHQTTKLPASLATLRLSAPAYAPLTAEMRNALKEQTDIRLVEDTDVSAAILTLSGEHIVSQVQAIDITGKVSDYLLNFSLTYSLNGADGKVLLPSQSIKLQREYTFDKLNVLAKAREDEFLRQEMRRDAVQQIMRRLTNLAPGV